MGILDPITDALSGKTPAPSAQAPDTKTTKITPDDIAATQRRRNEPEFQAALRAQAARNKQLGPGDYAFHPPAPPLRTGDQ